MTRFREKFPPLLILLSIFCPALLHAQTDCSAIQTECKSPEDGSLLSPECIVLRQRCDPFFVIPPGTEIPGQPQLYVQPEVPKQISSEPYGSSVSSPYPWGWRGYYGPRVGYGYGWGGGYGWPGNWGIGNGYNPFPLWRLDSDFPPPFRFLEEPFHSGFDNHPPDDDFLFFYGIGIYGERGAYHGGPSFRPPYGGPYPEWHGK